MKRRTTYLIACLAAVMLIGASPGFGATYNVKDYGATGDGVSNDTVAIRNCINAANNATGTKTVYFPAGTYLVNHIPITAIKGGSSGHGAKFLDKAPADLIFEGDGAAKSILKRNPIGGADSRVATMDQGNNTPFATSASTPTILTGGAALLSTAPPTLPSSTCTASTAMFLRRPSRAITTCSLSKAAPM